MAVLWQQLLHHAAIGIMSGEYLKFFRLQRNILSCFNDVKRIQAVRILECINQTTHCKSLFSLAYRMAIVR